ncbi:glycosyltransferase family 2 protein [Rhodoferax sp. 4810]|nr:glycosyltransferase family 2 protein [Rhodoferax jenense]
MCTKQGEPHLAEQLDSIIGQSHPHWTIWASDDGSTDGTLGILAQYQESLGAHRFSIAKGPAQGYVKNFLSLACNPSIAADVYAYSDQDDIWLPHKFKRALDWLNTVPVHVPALYCGRTLVVDPANDPVGFSPLFAKPPGFSNALVQSIAGGNTMVFNQAARTLLLEAGADVQVASHDWWTYQVVSACGGQVFYDPQPMVRYRQHACNVLGINNSWPARLARTGMLLRGRFSDWTSMNILALQRLNHHLTPGSRRQLDHFNQARAGGLVMRLAGIKRSGVYRQTKFGNLGLAAAIILKKI